MRSRWGSASRHVETRAEPFLHRAKLFPHRAEPSPHCAEPLLHYANPFPRCAKTVLALCRTAPTLCQTAPALLHIEPRDDTAWIQHLKLKRDKPPSSRDFRSNSRPYATAFAADKGFTGMMMDKIDVNGPNTDSVWAHLKEKFPGDVRWNFAAKFIIDKAGGASRTSTRLNVQSPPPPPRV